LKKAAYLNLTGVESFAYSVLLKNRTEKIRKKYTEYHYTRYDIIGLDKLC